MILCIYGRHKYCCKGNSLGISVAILFDCGKVSVYRSMCSLGESIAKGLSEHFLQHPAKIM